MGRRKLDSTVAREFLAAWFALGDITVLAKQLDGISDRLGERHTLQLVGRVEYANILLRRENMG